MALAPGTICRLRAMPPPTPVPRMMPKTVSAPAPAPSVASDKAKQLASLANLTGRPSDIILQRVPDQPSGVGVFDKAGDPGRSARKTDPDRGRRSDFLLDRLCQTSDCLNGAAIIMYGCGDPPADASDPGGIDCGPLNFAAAKIDADAEPC